MLGLKANVLSHFSPKQTPHAPKKCSITKSAGVNTSFAKFIEKSIIGKLLLSYLKVVTLLIFLTRCVLSLCLWIDFGKVANFFNCEK